MYGDNRDTNSLRPESFGCIAFLSLLDLVASSIETTSVSVTYYVDNDTTVKNSERTFIHDMASALEIDIDITIEINRIIRKSKVNMKVEHVHGHQDTRKKNDKLTPLEEINVLMDEIAGDHVRSMISRNSNTNLPFFLISQQIGISINIKPTMANIDDKLRGSYFQQDIMRHYHNTMGLDKNVFNNVNWEGRNITNIQEWTKNVASAIERGMNKTKEVTSDLSKFFSINKPPPRPRNRLIASFKKKMTI